MQETTTMMLYIADMKQNAFMRAVDLRPDYKVYVTGKETVSFKTSTLVNKDYFMRIIEKSKSNHGFWIPAIEHEGVLYVSPEIMELSDGNKIAFVGEAA